jgi:hypothetical protein
MAGWMDPGDNALEPAADIIYPVIDSLDTVQLIKDDEIPSDNSKVVALVTTGFYWRDTLKNILPSNKEGLVVVFNNPCSPSFTYLVK